MTGVLSKDLSSPPSLDAFGVDIPERSSSVSRLGLGDIGGSPEANLEGEVIYKIKYPNFKPD